MQIAGVVLSQMGDFATCDVKWKHAIYDENVQHYMKTWDVIPRHQNMRFLKNMQCCPVLKVGPGGVTSGEILFRKSCRTWFLRGSTKRSWDMFPWSSRFFGSILRFFSGCQRGLSWRGNKSPFLRISPPHFLAVIFSFYVSLSKIFVLRLLLRGSKWDSDVGNGKSLGAIGSMTKICFMPKTGITFSFSEALSIFMSRHLTNEPEPIKME